MKIKKIRAKDFREALKLVKKELGDDAVILSSEDKKGTRSFVEVTAAIDYDIETNQSACFSPSYANNDKNNSNDFWMLRNEIENLRQSIESIKNCGFELKMPEERKKMFYYLREKSIKEEFALGLVERAGSVEELETLMTDDITVAESDAETLPESVRILTGRSQKIIMLIGPTGVGKTTTIAKLATKGIREGKKVAIISIDTFKIGAAEQIRIYSRMIGIPLDIVSNVKNLKNSIRRFSDRDVLLIDTTGQNPKDNAYINELKNIYRTGLPIETQLLLSTSSDCDFLMNTYKHYRSLPLDYLAFTKTDEAVKLGSIYNLSCLYQKPVAYITTGQKVPGNIEFVDSRKLTNLILRTGSA